MIVVNDKLLLHLLATVLSSRMRSGDWRAAHKSTLKDV